jgi:hypothetical protein
VAQENRRKQIRDEEEHNRADHVGGAPTRAVDASAVEEWGPNTDVDRQRPDHVKRLSQYYRAHFSARHENLIQDVDYPLHKHWDKVVVHFRDDTYLRDRGDRLILSGKPTPEKAEFIVEKIRAKGINPVSISGSRQFKRMVALACFEYGLEVANPELWPYLEKLALTMPERRGVYADISLVDTEAPPAAAAPPPQEPSPPTSGPTVPPTAPAGGAGGAINQGDTGERDLYGLRLLRTVSTPAVSAAADEADHSAPAEYRAYFDLGDPENVGVVLASDCEDGLALSDTAPLHVAFLPRDVYATVLAAQQNSQDEMVGAGPLSPRFALAMATALAARDGAEGPARDYPDDVADALSALNDQLGATWSKIYFDYSGPEHERIEARGYMDAQPGIVVWRRATGTWEYRRAVVHTDWMEPDLDDVIEAETLPELLDLVETSSAEALNAPAEAEPEGVAGSADDAGSVRPILAFLYAFRSVSAANEGGDLLTAFYDGEAGSLIKVRGRVRDDGPDMVAFDPLTVEATTTAQFRAEVELNRTGGTGFEVEEDVPPALTAAAREAMAVAYEEADPAAVREFPADVVDSWRSMVTAFPPDWEILYLAAPERSSRSQHVRATGSVGEYDVQVSWSRDPDGPAAWFCRIAPRFDSGVVTERNAASLSSLLEETGMAEAISKAAREGHAARLADAGLYLDLGGRDHADGAAQVLTEGVDVGAAADGFDAAIGHMRHLLPPDWRTSSDARGGSPVETDLQWIDDVTSQFKELDDRLAEAAQRYGASTDMVDGLFLSYARMCVEDLLNPQVGDAIDLAEMRADRMSGLRTKLGNLEDSLGNPDANGLAGIPEDQLRSMRGEALRLWALADTACSHLGQRSYEVKRDPKAAEDLQHSLRRGPQTIPDLKSALAERFGEDQAAAYVEKALAEGAIKSSGTGLHFVEADNEASDQQAAPAARMARGW